MLNSGLDLFELYAYSFAVILAACSHKLYCYEKKECKIKCGPGKTPNLGSLLSVGEKAKHAQSTNAYIK